MIVSPFFPQSSSSRIRPGKRKLGFFCNFYQSHLSFSLSILSLTLSLSLTSYHTLFAFSFLLSKTEVYTLALSHSVDGRQGSLYNNRKKFSRRRLNDYPSNIKPLFLISEFDNDCNLNFSLKR